MAAVLILGVLLRFAQYLAYRLHCLDEASLALNFFEGGWGRSFQLPANHQSAPAGFSLLNSIVISIADISEYSLRLLPLLSGLGLLSAIMQVVFPRGIGGD